TGVAICDSFNGGSSPWYQVGGTSFSAPAWAGLIAIADQGRALNGLGSLDGSSGTLPALYQLAASDFHDITTGINGFNAGPGYDNVTGRGPPYANLVVSQLAGPPPANPATQLSLTSSTSSITSGSSLTVTVKALDSSNGIATSYTGTVHFSSSDVAA